MSCRMLSITITETGFIEDRYISASETVRSIFDIIKLTAKQNPPVLLIFIDFRKAFDSLEHNFLQTCWPKLAQILFLVFGV